jgi:hypothetical protein
MYKLGLSFLLFTFSVELALADEPYEVIGSSLKFGSNYTCLLDKAPRFAVLRQDLINCQAGHAVHVFSIPSNVGVLSDINILKNIYVALDFISTQPVAYLATVARVGSSRNLVSINGAYLAGKRIGDLRKSAFGSSGEAGASIISPDGRFVAPDGHIDCTEDAYPGVWDIQKNRRVKTTDDACVAFFK